MAKRVKKTKKAKIVSKRKYEGISRLLIAAIFITAVSKLYNAAPFILRGDVDWELMLELFITVAVLTGIWYRKKAAVYVLFTFLAITQIPILIGMFVIFFTSPLSFFTSFVFLPIPFIIGWLILWYIAVKRQWRFFT